MLSLQLWISHELSLKTPHEKSLKVQSRCYHFWGWKSNELFLANSWTFWPHFKTNNKQTYYDECSYTPRPKYWNVDRGVILYFPRCPEGITKPNRWGIWHIALEHRPRTWAQLTDPILTRTAKNHKQVHKFGLASINMDTTEHDMTTQVFTQQWPLD